MSNILILSILPKVKIQTIALKCKNDGFQCSFKMHCLSSLQCPLPTALHWALHLPVLRLPSVLLKIHGPYCCGIQTQHGLVKCKWGRTCSRTKKKKLQEWCADKSSKACEFEAVSIISEGGEVRSFLLLPSWFNPRLQQKRQAFSAPHVGSWYSPRPAVSFLWWS